MKKDLLITAHNDKVYTWTTVLVFLIASYLALANLTYVALWHDEAVNAIAAKNLLAVGAYSGWDGRNLFYGTSQGTGIDSNLHLASYAPWPPLPSALGLWLFGHNELGVRFFHALLGVLSLPLLWLLLRLDFSDRPRLRMLAFTCFALSTQVLLFMRQGRYYPDAFFFSLLAFYFYRLYWRDRKYAYLAIVVVATVLNFFNHFLVGGSVALSMAAWHSLFYRHQTNARQWIELSVAGAVTSVVCLIYLVWVGIIGSSEVFEYAGEGHIYQLGWLERHVHLVWFHLRDTILLQWLPLWVAVWWVYYLLLLAYRKKETKARKKQRALSAEDHAVRWAVMALLLLLFSSLLSVQPVKINVWVDSRYMIAALPFLAFMVAFCVDWMWQKCGAWMGIPLLMAFLMSTILGFPALRPNVFSGAAVRWTLPALWQEIHRPYQTAAHEIVDYLRQHAAQDDTVSVRWPNNAILYFYLSEQVIFCCQLDISSHLPRKKVRALGVPLYRGDVLPVWQVVFNGNEPEVKPELYQATYQAKAFYYTTQRPELEYHLFTPGRSKEGKPSIVFRHRD